jgi:uncharacterized metal-binding protein
MEYVYMNCLSCNAKACKKAGADCNLGRESVLKEYRNHETVKLYENADSLVSGGRAGKLSRLQEIIEFAAAQGYLEIAVAYCFSMEKQAALLKAVLEKNSFRVSSCRCTINGIKESDISPSLKGGVNCNPVGQAIDLNNGNADLVIEMGLCLGHDILFHRYLEKPFTVFAVKDRFHNHNPLAALGDAALTGL